MKSTSSFLAIVKNDTLFTETICISSFLLLLTVSPLEQFPCCTSVMTVGNERISEFYTRSFFIHRRKVLLTVRSTLLDLASCMGSKNSRAFEHCFTIYCFISEQFYLAYLLQHRVSGSKRKRLVIQNFFVCLFGSLKILSSGWRTVLERLGILLFASYLIHSLKFCQWILMRTRNET